MAKRKRTTAADAGAADQTAADTPSSPGTFVAGESNARAVRTPAQQAAADEAAAKTADEAADEAAAGSKRAAK